MVWRDHDPDKIATELWNESASSDSASELIRSLIEISEKYVDYYDISFEEAAYRAAGESLDWWPHGNSQHLLWAPDVLSTLLYPENVSLVVDHMTENWDQCHGWKDSLKLIDESVLGTAALQMGPPKIGRQGAFPKDPANDHPQNRIDEEWNEVFKIDASNRHGPIRRAAKLREVADLYHNEFAMDMKESIQEIVQTYVEVQDTTVSFYEAFNLYWDPHLDPLDEQFTKEWWGDVDAIQWIQQVSAIVFKWNIVEEMDSIDSYVDRWGF